MRHDIHDYESKLRREWIKILNSNLPQESKEVIGKFKRDLEVEGLSSARILRYLVILRMANEKFLQKPLSLWDEEDIKAVMVKIQEKVRTGEYTKNTAYEFRKTFRKFFKWLHGEEWKGLRVLRGSVKKRNKPDVLTEEEILKMIEVAGNLRDKALIAVGYEGGFRIGELSNIRIGDVSWVVDSSGTLKARVKVSGKTGERVVPIVMAAQYLKRWLEVHPRKDELQAYVFCSLSLRKLGEPLEYQTFRKIIQETAKKAGIKKRVHPHILRHSRATVLANFLTEAQMCEYFGWIQGSDMPAIYVHLSGRDIDNAIDAVYGIGEGNKQDVEAKPKKCPRCGYLNAPTDFYCGRCALILDESKRVELEVEEMRFMKEIMEIVDSETFRKAREMVELVERMRSNPELFNFLLQVKD